jgi:membrane-bound lytic murein transglycosylase F
LGTSFSSWRGAIGLFHRRARYGYCRGSEPVKYVSEIQNRYASYVERVPH